MVDGELFETSHGGLIKYRTSIERDLFSTRNQHRLCQCTAEHAIAQRFDDVTAVEQRRHRDPAACPAVDLRNNQVLCNVNEATREVTRVSCLQRRIRETLAGTMRRNEVLQNVQTFTEVCGNRCLNNRPIRLGHQTTHASKLPDLRR